MNAATWTEKKVTIRNKDAERFDPDFTRHGPPRGAPIMGGPYPGGFMGMGPPPPPGSFGVNMPIYPPQPMWAPPGVMMGGARPEPWADGGRGGRFSPSQNPPPSFGSFEYQPHSNYSPAPTAAAQRHPSRLPPDTHAGPSQRDGMPAPSSSDPASYQEAFPPLG